MLTFPPGTLCISPLFSVHNYVIIKTLEEVKDRQLVELSKSANFTKLREALGVLALIKQLNSIFASTGIR
jgi:hypothetical protein